MILQPLVGTLISNELLRGLDSALTQRQIEKGLKLLHEHAAVVARANPNCDNAARVADHLARWIDMDFSLLAPVEKLIQRFSRSARARLPLGDSLRIRLARGITRMHRGQFDDAIVDFSLVIAAKEEIADRSMLMIANYCLGRCYRNKGMYETAAAYTRDAARLASGSRLAKQRTVIRVLESWILFQQGDIDEASRGLKQVERQLSATDDYISRGNVFCFRARLTRRSGNHDEALKLWESGVEMFRRRKSYKSIRSCLRNDHWYQKLVWSYREWHLVTRITFGKLRPTSHWCFLCPDKSMAPVLAITDMVARARRDDSLL